MDEVIMDYIENQDAKSTMDEDFTIGGWTLVGFCRKQTLRLLAEGSLVLQVVRVGVCNSILLLCSALFACVRFIPAFRCATYGVIHIKSFGLFCSSFIPQSLRFIGGLFTLSPSDFFLYSPILVIRNFVIRNCVYGVLNNLLHRMFFGNDFSESDENQINAGLPTTWSSGT
jgi:hypothetical protein